MFSEGRLVLSTPKVVYNVEFCVVFLWTPSHCQLRANESLAGSERVSHRSTSTVWACPSPVFIKHNYLLPPALPFPPLLPHPPTCYLPWGAKGARGKNTHVVKVTCERPDSAETSLVALLKQLFRQDRAWVRWCPSSWLNGNDCADALALLSLSKGLNCGSKLWFPLPLTSLTLRVFNPEIMPYSMLSSRLSQISLEQK